VYEYWDEFNIAAIAPKGAVSAALTLYYQGTSWEYVQFLNNAVSTTLTGTGAPNPITPFLADEGKNFLDAWVNAVDANGNTMVPPHVMATATWGAAQCVPEPEICDDTIDNDCDNLVDCADPDCDGTPECPNLIEFPFCFDGLDNDFDGPIDCADRTDCDDVSEITTCGLGVCASTGSQTCNNGTLDEIICTPLPATEPGTEITCDDGLDNDCDGAADSADTDCGMACADYMNKGDCNNDANCEWQGSPKNGMCVDVVVCTPTGPELGNCNDGIDNDCDGMTDCAEQTECDMYADMCRWKRKQMECVNR
jgi:hypothetical protein